MTNTEIQTVTVLTCHDPLILLAPNLATDFVRFIWLLSLPAVFQL